MIGVDVLPLNLELNGEGMATVPRKSQEVIFSEEVLRNPRKSLEIFGNPRMRGRLAGGARRRRLAPHEVAGVACAVRPRGLRLPSAPVSECRFRLPGFPEILAHPLTGRRPESLYMNFTSKDANFDPGWAFKVKT